MAQTNNKLFYGIAIAAVLIIGTLTTIWFTGLPNFASGNNKPTEDTTTKVVLPPPPPHPNMGKFTDENGNDYDIKIINPTYLNNERRNYYGDSLPSELKVIWKLSLGSGPTQVGAIRKNWSGAGWTGQPLMVLENGRKYIIQGAFDHRLKKIDYETGEVIWQYRFDDVVKGTGTIWFNHKADSLKHKLVILQGTRAGGKLNHKIVDCYRAISYFTGEELWRLNSPRTACYSRDVDGSALILNDTAYLALETGIFAVFNPDCRQATVRDGLLQPLCHKFSDTLYRPQDARLHGGNVVSEASPAKLGDHVYVASGSGRVWGFNLNTQKMDWEYYIGSDIDGSTVVTDDKCILVSVEKQYIKGQGGILKLDPSKKPEDATVWYLPTGNLRFVSWQGGVIGTAATNEATRKPNHPHLGATVAIDGYTYVFDLEKIDTTKKVKLFDGVTEAATPVVYFKYKTGGSIASPIIIGNRLAVPTYEGFFLFEFDDQMNFRLLEKIDMRGEATPYVDNGRIFWASRDGFLYCLGSNPSGKEKTIKLSYDTEVNGKGKKQAPKKVLKEEPKKDTTKNK